MNRVGFFIVFTLVSIQPSIATPSTEAIFEKFWKESQKIVYDREREKEFWTKENYQELKAKAYQTQNVYELQGVINKFLDKLGVSHTRFYTDQDEDFYFFRSLFTTRDVKSPKIKHIGIQYEQVAKEYIVREVLNGYPAYKSGIKRGDKIIQCDAKAFSPISCFKNTQTAVQLKIRRASKLVTVRLAPVHESLHESFLKAMVNSIKVTEVDGKQIGYIRLWAGTNDMILEKYRELIKSKLLDVDGLILDLRGGFGGAWYDYLDPYFETRKDFFVSTWIARDGKQTINKPTAKTFNWYFQGPMVVLINEGVRSGKESLAYQFKKSKRATIVGEKTAGAFTAGYALFKEMKLNYFLYLASAEILLDGSKIEGVGISPDVKVPYPLIKPPDSDPQLKKGYEALMEKLTSKQT